MSAGFDDAFDIWKLPGMLAANPHLPIPTELEGSMRNNRYYRRSYRQSESETMTAIDSIPKDKIIQALAEAISHTNTVSVREHIKADRIERVNQFIVSLRTHLHHRIPGDYKNARDILITQLCQKELWIDVGVVNTAPERRSCTIPYHNLQAWVVQAKAIMPQGMDLAEDIQATFGQMRGQIMMAAACNETTTNINNQADKVLHEMSELAKDM